MPEETFGENLRRMRQARGWSLRRLSEESHIDKGHLSRIERDQRPASEAIASAVDAALQAGGSLIGLAQVQRAVAERAAVTSDSMRRRTFVTAPLAVAVASLGGADDELVAVGRVGAADAQRLHRAVTRLRVLGHQHGGESLWQAAAGIAREGYTILEQGTFSAAVGDQILAATGRAQMCAGWLAFDSGRQDIARSCYNEALALARQASNHGIEVHALVNLAFQSTFLRMPRQALRYADAAERIAQSYDPTGRIAVVPLIRQATAHAIAGDRGESAKATTLARRRLDKSHQEGDDWCAFVSPAELDAIEATTAMLLGDTARAEPLLEQAVAAHNVGFARNRALYRVRLARTRLDRGDIVGGALSANEALDDLSGEVASWVVNAELQDVAQRMAHHPGDAEAERFMDRYIPATSR
ncbi:helix-turn-helix domain-containing protein [Catellatospora citrea]|uniref:MFS transporter n=1 Tax=Catellatospora citrea TaxID=53366 RepID=A0A8J3NZV3_9ACTN|nr:helix-turn-helix transcriptional regulator [Catellatospora citrea]RKE05301.1 helix-turn-helix protein [Catellatospora citrea]GIF98231.1 MFS transporter [Catellatospora citrea]